MITKTLIGLIIVLIVTIATSYYMNKEGFDDASNAAYAYALSVIAYNVASTQLITATTADISLAITCYAVAEKSISDAITKTYNALADIKTKIAALNATSDTAKINKDIIDIIGAGEYIKSACVSLTAIATKSTSLIPSTDPLKVQLTDQTTKMTTQSALMTLIINSISTKINGTSNGTDMKILFTQFANEKPPYTQLIKSLTLSTPAPTATSTTTTIADDLLLLQTAAIPIPAMTSPEVIVWPDNDNNTFRLEAKVINGSQMTVDIVKNLTSPYERMNTTGILVGPTRSQIWSKSKNMMTDKTEYYIVRHAVTLSGILTPLGSFVYNKSGYEDYWRNNRDRYGEDYDEDDEDTSRKPNLIYDEDGAYPKNENVDPDTTLSATAYEAIELQKRSKLLEDIQKTVRNEVLAARSTTPVEPGCDTVQTELIAQGQEYTDTCYKGNKDTCYNDTEYKCPKNPDGSCPPIPDMTKFIKKDSVPCWGCNIDY